MVLLKILRFSCDRQVERHGCTAAVRSGPCGRVKLRDCSVVSKHDALFLFMCSYCKDAFLCVNPRCCSCVRVQSIRTSRRTRIVRVPTSTHVTVVMLTCIARLVGGNGAKRGLTRIMTFEHVPGSPTSDDKPMCEILRWVFLDR